MAQPRSLSTWKAPPWSSAGPAGFYAAQKLLSLPDSQGLKVDMFEELPTPFGLVRYGVAPDHPEVKVCGAVVTPEQRHKLNLRIPRIANTSLNEPPLTLAFASSAI